MQEITITLTKSEIETVSNSLKATMGAIDDRLKTSGLTQKQRRILISAKNRRHKLCLWLQEKKAEAE